MARCAFMLVLVDQAGEALNMICVNSVDANHGGAAMPMLSSVAPCYLASGDVIVRIGMLGR